jgi:hypothetical protein
MMNIFEETYDRDGEQHRKPYKAATTDEGQGCSRESLRSRQGQDGSEGRHRLHDLESLREIKRQPRTRSSNFDDIIWDRDVEALTTCMRENGIKTFTYSCQATDAIETLWLFKQAGCIIGEMVEINLRKDFWGKGYEKGHAFKMILHCLKEGDSHVE